MPQIDLKTLSPKSFPLDEDDAFEFKSSLTPLKKLASEIECAASAFANSGGGCLIAGVNDKTVEPDGGYEPLVGRTPLRDWIDQHIAKVDPRVQYDVRIYDDNEGRGQLEPGKVIAAISIHPSHIGPHMASDNRYYIRAGAHTVPANHWIVEALWARRQATTPRLSHFLRESRSEGAVLEIGIVNLTDSPALDVEVNLHPLPPLHEYGGSKFPCRVPVISKAVPFVFDLMVVGMDVEGVSPGTVLAVKYKDLAGNQHLYKNSHDLLDSAPPSVMWRKSTADIVRAIDELKGEFKHLR